MAQEKLKPHRSKTSNDQKESVTCKHSLRRQGLRRDNPTPVIRKSKIIIATSVTDTKHPQISISYSKGTKMKIIDHYPVFSYLAH